VNDHKTFLDLKMIKAFCLIRGSFALAEEKAERIIGPHDANLLLRRGRRWMQLVFRFLIFHAQPSFIYKGLAGGWFIHTIDGPGRAIFPAEAAAVTHAGIDHVFTDLTDRLHGTDIGAQSAGRASFLDDLIYRHRRPFAY
jgi:hypothetical protein